MVGCICLYTNRYERNETKKRKNELYRTKRSGVRQCTLVHVSRDSDFHPPLLCVCVCVILGIAFLTDVALRDENPFSPLRRCGGRWFGRAQHAPLFQSNAHGHATGERHVVLGIIATPPGHQTVHEALHGGRHNIVLLRGIGGRRSH